MRRPHAWLLSLIAALLLLLQARSSGVAETLAQIAREDDRREADSGALAFPTKHFVEMDFLGDKTRREISRDGKLVERYAAAKLDGSLVLVIAEGTSFLVENNEPPATIAVEVCPQRIPVSADQYVIGDIYRLTALAADGSVLNFDCSPGFQLVSNYTAEATREGTSSVHFDRYDEQRGVWDTRGAGAGPTSAARQVSNTGNHAGTYAVTASVSALPTTPSPGRIEVRDLTLGRSPAKTGQPIAVTAEAVNTGWSGSQRALAFEVSGSVLERTTIALAPGQERELHYSFTPAGPGEYHVRIGEAAGTFTAAGPARDSSEAGLATIPLLGNIPRPEAWWSLIPAVALLAMVLILFPIKAPGDKAPRTFGGE